MSDFEKEMRENVPGRDRQIQTQSIVFFLVNVMYHQAKRLIEKVDRSKAELLGERKDFHVDVLWQEHVVAWLY